MAEDDDLEQLSRRNVKLPHALALMVVGIAGGGGAGTMITGQDLAEEVRSNTLALREAKAEILGKIGQVQIQIGEQGRRLEAFNVRLRDAEHQIQAQGQQLVESAQLFLRVDEKLEQLNERLERLEQGERERRQER